MIRPTEGRGLLVNITSSNALHVPFVTVQRTVAFVPDVMPVIVVVGDPGVVIVAKPLIKVHTPLPTLGLLCVMVKVLVLQRVWFG